MMDGAYPTDAPSPSLAYGSDLEVSCEPVVTMRANYARHLDEGPVATTYMAEGAQADRGTASDSYELAIGSESGRHEALRNVLVVREELAAIGYVRRALAIEPIDLSPVVLGVAELSQARDDHAVLQRRRRRQLGMGEVSSSRTQSVATASP